MSFPSGLVVPLRNLESCAGGSEPLSTWQCSSSCTGSGLYALQGGCAPEPHAAAAGASGGVRCGVWRRSHRQDCRLTLTDILCIRFWRGSHKRTLEGAVPVRSADAIVDVVLGYDWGPAPAGWRCQWRFPFGTGHSGAVHVDGLPCLTLSQAGTQPVVICPHLCKVRTPFGREGCRTLEQDCNPLRRLQSKVIRIFD